jgi:4-alpha-glucanotransferase
MEAAGVFKKRRAGVLLHITSLPSGTLGDDVFKFIDFLHHAKVSIWQMLPINPTHSDGSPYQCLSAHAINPSLLSHEKLKTEAWFDEHQNQTNLIGSAHQQFFDKANE